MTLTLLQLRPAQITTHPRNPRTEVGDVSALADRALHLARLHAVSRSTAGAREPTR